MSYDLSLIHDTQQVDYRKLLSAEKNIVCYIVQTRKRRLKVWKLLQVLLLPK